MNQYNEISTLQYMGSKARIISHICEPIIKNEHIKTVVDFIGLSFFHDFQTETVLNQPIPYHIINVCTKCLFRFSKTEELFIITRV